MVKIILLYSVSLLCLIGAWLLGSANYALIALCCGFASISLFFVCGVLLGKRLSDKGYDKMVNAFDESVQLLLEDIDTESDEPFDEFDLEM